MSSTIVVTGAAQGIGAAVAVQLLQEGYRVIGIDRQPQPEQWPITQQLSTDLAGWWQGISQDLALYEQTQLLLDEILQHHQVVGLVNAAGMLMMTTLLEARLQDWQQSLSVNLLAPILLSQRMARHFCENRRGSIVTISSNSARMPRTQLGMYATTKAALSHFCRNLGLETAPYQVRVNIVSPGSTLTQMQKQLWHDDQPPASVLDGDLAQYRLGIPLRKLAQPEDIAHTVSFLLSDQAAHISLQEIVVDGGATLGV